MPALPAPRPGVVARGHRQRQDALVDVLEVDLHRLRFGFFLACLLVVLLASLAVASSFGFLASSAHLSFRLGRGLARLRLLLVAFGRERRRRSLRSTTR